MAWSCEETSPARGLVTMDMTEGDSVHGLVQEELERLGVPWDEKTKDRN